MIRRPYRLLVAAATGAGLAVVAVWCERHDPGRVERDRLIDARRAQLRELFGLPGTGR